MVSPEARSRIDRLFAKRRDENTRLAGRRPLDIQRRDGEAEARLDVLPRGARFQPVNADGVGSEWMAMPAIDNTRVILWLHGGSYTTGSPRISRKMAAQMSRAGHCRVLTPAYRLAPEHPFPAAVKDVLGAYRFLLAQGFTEDRIVIGGDAAGGGLALSSLLALREAGAAMPRCAVLLSPWTDLSCSGASYERQRKLDPIIDKETMVEAGRYYLGARNPRDPTASPLFADANRLPPLLIHVGGDEAMLDDSRLFAERARAAVVDVSLKVFEGMWHVHHRWAPEVPEAVGACNEVGAFLRAQFGD